MTFIREHSDSEVFSDLLVWGKCDMNSSDTEAPFLDLNLSITNGIVSSKIYDKRDEYNFEIVNFPFLDGDAPRPPSYGVFISQLIRYARVCSNVDDFNNRNRGSYMSDHVLLNLLNELGKRDKMRGLSSILSLFRNEFIKFNITRARMLDSIYHMTNTLKSHFWRKNVLNSTTDTQS